MVSKGLAVTRLILASASPRRKKLLEEAGYDFEIIPSDIHEGDDLKMSPREAAEYLACEKAKEVASRVREGLVIGADTVVEIGSRRIGKPKDQDDAIRILSELSGARQYVITGVCLWNAGSGEHIIRSDSTEVSMRQMTQLEIEEYVDSGEAYGKAGAYAIQETGDRFVEEVKGSLSNVVGLPMELFEKMLEEMTEEKTPKA